MATCDLRTMPNRDLSSGDLPTCPSSLSVFARNTTCFIDPTQALVDETKKGNLTYNHVFDTHLNRFGSLIVAETIAEELERDRRQ